MVTAQYLLEGLLYSLEQAGVLLRDAVALYKTGANSNAIVLAAFAREEIGRSCILQNLRKKAVDGESVTLKIIKDKCGDHVTKQQWGQLSVVQRPSEHEGLSKLIRAKMENDPESAEFNQANEMLSEVTKHQQKRNPADRHRVRMNSLYVEPNETGSGWNRPQLISQTDAETFLLDAVNDYSLQYELFQRGFIKDDDPDLFRALQSWAGRPELPQPQPPWT